MTDTSEPGDTGAPTHPTELPPFEEGGSSDPGSSAPTTGAGEDVETAAAEGAARTDVEGGAE